MSTEQQLTEAEESKKYGKRVLIILISFFAVFASVDAFFIYKALKTQPGVVTENAYERGLNYNDLLKEAREREAKKNGATNTATPNTEN